MEWKDSELGADNVYAWAKEQAGEVSHERFGDRMSRNDLSLSSAAAAPGISRRMAACYRMHRTPFLAMCGWPVLDGRLWAAGVPVAYRFPCISLLPAR